MISGGAMVPVLCVLLACITSGTSAVQLTQVLDVMAQHAGSTLLYRGAPHTAFSRPLPHTVDPSLLSDFEGHLNRTQAFSADGDNEFEPTGQQFVASIRNGYVSGVLGSVFDGDGRVYAQFTPSLLSGVPQTVAEVQALPCKRFKKLATTIQKYGHMYYHFLLEVLPRAMLLEPLLDADTKLLMFGSPYEAAWLAAVGIDAARVEVYDPALTYCADELLVPTPTLVITPAKETLELVRHHFVPPAASSTASATAAAAAPKNDLIVYCSRAGAADRTVANEASLLVALRSAFPDHPLAVFTGSESVADTVSLFRRARAVVGMHGAGLSHLLFSEPGTAVVELLFMRDPPMMFWHAAGALGLQYWMVPLAQSYWLATDVVVSERDVVDALAAALGGKGDAPEDACGAGSLPNSVDGSLCTQCRAGTYRPAEGLHCTPCASGRYSAAAGAAACRTCQDDFYSVAATACKACPAGTKTLFPAASSPAECQSEAALTLRLDSLFSLDVLASKLVKIPALIARLRPTGGPGRSGRQLRAAALQQQVHAQQLSFLDALLMDLGSQQQQQQPAAGTTAHSTGGAAAGDGARRLAYVTPPPHKKSPPPSHKKPPPPSHKSPPPSHTSPPPFRKSPPSPPPPPPGKAPPPAKSPPPVRAPPPAKSPPPALSLPPPPKSSPLPLPKPPPPSKSSPPALPPPPPPPTTASGTPPPPRAWCGAKHGNCPDSQCCSSDNLCGTLIKACGSGCQKSYGSCGVKFVVAA